jgi:hypothetical protein
VPTFRNRPEAVIDFSKDDELGMPEMKTRFDVSKILAIVSAIACLGMVAVTFSMSNRIAKLERVVSFREEADPLRPDECPTDGVVCDTSIDRVMIAPQKYHGRRLAVAGLYVSSFETSALYSSEVKGEPKHSQAIWINGGLQETDAGQTVTIVGLFKRGPAGHMDEYLGEMSGVRRIP